MVKSAKKCSPLVRYHKPNEEFEIEEKKSVQKQIIL
jgi:hypothetical protein